VIVDLHVLVRDLCNEFVLFKDKATVRAAPNASTFLGSRNRLLHSEDTPQHVAGCFVSFKTSLWKPPDNKCSLSRLERIF